MLKMPEEEIHTRKIKRFTKSRYSKRSTEITLHGKWSMCLKITGDADY